MCGGMVSHWQIRNSCKNVDFWCCDIGNGNGALLILMCVRLGTIVIFPFSSGVSVPKMFGLCRCGRYLSYNFVVDFQ